jgi:large subunit ribosomal protein L10
MTKEQKAQSIDEITDILKQNSSVYLTDTTSLNATQTSNLRRECFKNDIQIKVVKNTLLKKAMEKIEDRDYTEMYGTLKGNTTLLLSNVGNSPAKLIQNFRKKSQIPALKSAWIDQAVYVGDNQLINLVNLKSKDELVADIIALLQSPMKNVISALNSGGQTIAGIVKTLSNKSE